MEKRNNAGFGIVEIIVAMAIFVTIAATATTTILQSFSINRLGNEESQANLLAQEGLEAVRSIKNRNWPSLDIGSTACGASITRGLTSAPNWAFSGTSQTLGKYTRTITIANVCRTGSNAITEPGTTYDADVKKVTATIAWTFTSGRANSVVLTTYLSRFDKAIRKGGMLAYANLAGGTSNDQIQYKTLNSPGEWTTAQNIPDFAVPLDRPARVIELYSSTTRNEKILITKHVINGSGNDQYLYAQVWNGTTASWGNVVQLASWAGTTRPESRDFDGDYLNNGNFLLVYEDNTTTPKYIVWNGTSWTTPANTVNVGGNPEWIVVRNRSTTNEAMVGILDDGNDTNTIYWNGTSWTGLTEHGTAGAGAQFESIDFAWSLNTPTTGALVYNEASDNNPNIRIWNGTSWSSSVETVNIGDVPRSMNLVPRAGANEFLACFKDSANDIDCLEGNHTPTWSTLINGEVTATTDTNRQRSFFQAFERPGGTLGLVVYSDTTATPKYRTFNPATNTFSSQQSLTALLATLETVNLYPHPDTNDVMAVMGGSGQRVYTQVWNGTNDTFYTTGGYGQTTHGTLGSGDLDFWFDFAWDRL